MPLYVLGLEEVDRTKLAVVGGKALGLAEFSRLAGIRVPKGFCVTTAAYARTVAKSPELGPLLDWLSALPLGDRAGISQTSSGIRTLIEGLETAADIEGEIVRHLSDLGEEEAPYAVR